MTKDLPGLGSGALREALVRIKALVCGDRHPNWTDEAATWQTRNRIADICDLELLSLSSPIDAALKEKELTVAGHIRQAAADGCQCEPCCAARSIGAQASSEIREVERIAQEMCALATEKHHSGDGYAYEKLGKYGKRILDAQAPSRQGAAKRVEG